MKTLIFLRHGHRDVTLRENDNALSEKGRGQAKNIRRFFMERFTTEQISGGVDLLSSPKLRCIETLKPLAKALEREVQIERDLNEDTPGERALEVRVRSSLATWSERGAAITVCASHGDWLPFALYHLLGLHVDVRKGAWIECEADFDRTRLTWMVPSFKAFYGG